MKEIKTSIEVNEIKYPLVFNLNVMEVIQEEYGSIEKWGELTDGKGQEVNAKALIFGLREMINEGIDIENDTAETKREPLTKKQAGRIITSFGLEKMAEKMQNTIIESTKNDNEQKNV